MKWMAQWFARMGGLANARFSGACLIWISAQIGSKWLISPNFRPFDDLFLLEAWVDMFKNIVHLHTYICIYMYTYIYIYINMHICIFIWVYFIYIYKINIHMYICISYTYVYIIHICIVGVWSRNIMEHLFTTSGWGKPSVAELSHCTAQIGNILARLRRF